jgi:hypothetical protein
MTSCDIRCAVCHVRPSASCTSVEQKWFIVESQGPWPWTFCFPLLLVTAWLNINTSRVHSTPCDKSHNSCTAPEKSTIYPRFFFLSFISALLCPVFPVLRRVRKILRKSTFGFVKSGLSVSVRMEQLGSQMNGFSWNYVFENFSKICRENSGFNKILRE